MADKNNPAFAPDTGGPFSEYLNPNQVANAQIPVPGAKIPKAAAAAAIIDKFLEGMERGKVQAFANQERARSQKRQALDSAYAQIRQDHEEGKITEEAYNKASQVYFHGIGNVGLGELNGQDQGDGKKKPKKGKDQDQPQTPGDHVKNIAKGIFTGLTGGKMTPGVDVGNSLIAMQNAVYGKDGNPLPQYNTKSLVASTQEQLDKAASALPPELNREAAAAKLQPLFNKLDQYNPKAGAQARNDYLGRFQQSPPPGSQADLNLKMQQMFPAVAPGTQPVPPGAGQAPTAAAPPGTAPGAPPSLTGAQLSALRTAKAITKEGNIEYDGADGKKVRGEGIRVNVPNRGEFWYVRDGSGNPVGINQAGIREVGMAQDPQPKAKTEAEKTEDRAFDAYRESHKVPPGAKLTASQELEALRKAKEGSSTTGSAERLYRETHKIGPDDTLTEKQSADAIDEWKTLTDPAKKAKFGAGATSAKSLRTAATANPMFDIQAWDFLTKGTFDVRGIGKDASTAAEQIIARSQQIMRDNGLGAGDVIALRAGVKADTGALARVTTQGATVNQLEDQLSRNMDIAKRLDTAFKRSDTPFVNGVMAAFNTGTGSPEALNLAAQLHAVSREWAKLMQGQTSAAGVSIKEAAETDKLISNRMASGQLQSLFKDVISQDAKTRSQAIDNERQRLVDSIRGVTSGNKKINGTYNPSDPSSEVVIIKH